MSGLFNLRPLTYASLDPDDFRPLTPNNFLNRAPLVDLSADKFSRSLPRDHYRYTQRLATLFSVLGPVAWSLFKVHGWTKKIADAINESSCGRLRPR
jgi:hypothetical protein